MLPNKGMASETWGSVSATRFKNTVSESKMVTPETNFLDSIFAEHVQKTLMISNLANHSLKKGAYVYIAYYRERFTFCG